MVCTLATLPPSAWAATFLFYACALLTVLSAWAIVVSGNIVRMAVYLLLTLAGAAGLYFLLDAELLAAVQLIVYAGGTLILIVFGVMLTARHPRAALTVPTAERVLAALVGAVIAATLVLAISHSQDLTASTGLGATPADAQTNPPAAPPYDAVAAIGRLLLSTYLVPFEAAAVLLLVVMVGAAYLARRREPPVLEND